jgi:hypothetical protein
LIKFRILFFLHYSRYQQKIGSYDKQKWEKTLEESKILENAFPLRNTTLKTDLIDVDLVRGSTFPKAKPKQSLIQVLYLSVLRSLFLPLFSKWWVKQTSAKMFVVLLSLYFLQMINWAIYSLHIRSISNEGIKEGSKSEDGEEENQIELCELLIPMGLSLLLCFTHSQIVATSVIPSRTSNKRRRKVSLSGKSRYEKIKRKKKIFRQRISTNSSTSLDLETHCKGYDSDDESIVMKTAIESKNEETVNFSLSSSSIPASSASAVPTTRRRRNVNWDLTSNNNSNNVSFFPYLKISNNLINSILAS